MSAIPTKAFDTWKDYKEWLLDYAKLRQEGREAYLFRGQRDSSWPLQSSLDRCFPQLSSAERITKVKRLLNQFAVEIYGLESGFVERTQERLELLGRHHGLPTTVLDWTRSPYIAAYFAFESECPPKDGNTVIYRFDRRKLTQSPLAPQVLIDNVTLVGDNTRALLQRGVFIRLPVGTTGEEALSPGLIKICLPYSERRVALVDLDAMLINAKNLFRDHDAAARTAMLRESLD